MITGNRAKLYNKPVMEFMPNVSLADYSTMGLGGAAAYLVEAANRAEVVEALTWANEHQLPTIMIGNGSNIVWRDEGFNGLVIVNKIMGYEVFKQDDEDIYLTVGAGENWDSVVERSVNDGLTGIEALSLIPGTTGATPVQNVGAYGQEISQTLTMVEAYDTQEAKYVNIPGSDCGFAYRTSRFNTVNKGRYYITGITLHLRKGAILPPFYSGLTRYFEEHNITNCPPNVVRDSVIAIRTAKLPNPALVKNNGSFFANPIVNDDEYSYIQQNYPQVPHWSVGKGSTKLSAAWLIDQAGFNNYTDEATGMATWPQQSLVLINKQAKTTADLLTFKKKVTDAVHEKFNITLVQEPELLPELSES